MLQLFISWVHSIMQYIIGHRNGGAITQEMKLDGVDVDLIHGDIHRFWIILQESAILPL